MSIVINASTDTTDVGKCVARTREVLKDNGFGILTPAVTEQATRQPEEL